MEQQEFLKKELKREVLTLLIPLVVGISGLIALVSITECPIPIVLLVVFLSIGMGIGIFLGLLVDFLGNFLPYYLALRK